MDWTIIGDDKEKELMAKIDKLYAKFQKAESELEKVKWELEDYRISKGVLENNPFDVALKMRFSLSPYAPKYMRPIKLSKEKLEEITKKYEHL